MLQHFRNHLVGWFSKILIGLISIAFALFGIQYYLVSSHANPSIATVNGEKIGTTDLTAAYNRQRNQLINQFGTSFRLTTELQEQLRQKALNDLILRTVMYQGVSKAGFVVSPLTLQAVIEQLPAFQVDGQFSPERFQHVLYNLSYSESSFYQDMIRSLAIGQLSEGIVQSAFALPNEIDQAYLMATQKRDFKYLTLPVKEFEKEVILKDADIQSYYNAHKKDYQSEAQVSVDYVELNIDAIKAKQKVSDAEVQEYYQNNQMAFASPMRWQIAKGVVSLPKGAKESDIQAAKTRAELLADQFRKKQHLSADVKSEWVSPTKDNAQLVKLFTTMKVGQVSPLQKNSDGFEVYKLLAVEEPKPQPLSAVRSQVSDAILKQKAEHEYTTLSDQLAELAFTHPDSLEPIAQTLGSSVQSTGLFTRRGSKEGIEASPKIVSTAFSDEVLQQNSNSTPIDLGNGRLVVLRIKSSQPAQLLPLDKVKDKIVAILKRQQAEVAIEKVAATLVEQFRAGKNPSDLLSKYQVAWHQQNGASRQEKGIDQAILQLAFRQPAGNEKSPAYDSAALANGDYAIVSVEKIIPSQLKTMTAEQRDSFKNSLAVNLGTQDFNSYVKELRDKAKVDVLKKQRQVSPVPDLSDDY